VFIVSVIEIKIDCFMFVFVERFDCVVFLCFVFCVLLFFRGEI
jgi:hypothetical protein